ncbi:MAG: hypothetical protein FRX49_09847 [Trebouxia sp. A1-2]|nr:MAG: hypothetical protein FRX49_09847 [Trebouxia sp. A1-2]
MSPKTFPGQKAIPQIQSTSPRSTASSSTLNGWPQPSAVSAPHQEFVPQQQTYGFNGPREITAVPANNEQAVSGN